MTEQLSDAQQQLAELKLAKENAEKELQEAKDKAAQIQKDTEERLAAALAEAEAAKAEAALLEEQSSIKDEQERKKKEEEAELLRLETLKAKEAEDQALIDAMESYEKGAEKEEGAMFAKHSRDRSHTAADLQPRKWKDGDRNWIGAKDDADFTFTNF